MARPRLTDLRIRHKTQAMKTRMLSISLASCGQFCIAVHDSTICKAYGRFLKSEIEIPEHLSFARAKSAKICLMPG